MTDRAAASQAPSEAILDPVIARRLQSALTTILHIIFPVVTMGLAPFLVYFTWKDIRTALLWDSDAFTQRRVSIA